MELLFTPPFRHRYVSNAEHLRSPEFPCWQPAPHCISLENRSGDTAKVCADRKRDMGMLVSGMPVQGIVRDHPLLVEDRERWIYPEHSAWLEQIAGSTSGSAYASPPIHTPNLASEQAPTDTYDLRMPPPTHPGEPKSRLPASPSE